MSGTRNADLEIAIKAKAQDAIAQFNRFTKSVDDNKKSIDSIKKTAGIAFAAVSAGLAFSIKEAIKAEEVDRRLDTQLKKLGMTSKGLSDDLKKTATQIANMSNYTDDDLKVAMIRLLGVTKDYNMALKYTQTAADLAARKDISLEQATQMLTMAYTGNIGRLKMQGIVLEDGVKGMEALEAISKDVAGGAADNIKPLTQLTNQIGELGETLGGPFVQAAYSYAKAATEGVKSIIQFNEQTGGGISIAMKYSLAVTGIVTAAAFLAPKLKEAAGMAKIFASAIAAHPVVAAAAAVALLANALLDYADKQVDAYSEKQGFLATDAGLLAQAKENLAILKNSSQPQTEITEGLKKRSVATIEYAGRLEKLIEVIEKKQKIDKLDSDYSPADRLKGDLKSRLDDMGVATKEFTDTQVDKYNDMYTSVDEMDQASTELKIKRLEEANQQEIALANMTAEEKQRIQEQELNAVGDMFGNLSSLMSSESRNQFEVGKAAAIAQALIDTYAGAQKAFTSLAGIPVVGPVLGVAGAAAAIVAGTMRVSQIQSTQFNPKGAAEGVFDFRDKGNGENLVTTVRRGESIIPPKFTDAIRTGQASLGGGKSVTLTLQINGDMYGVPKDEFITNLTQRLGELIQSGNIPVGNLTGATS